MGPLFLMGHQDSGQGYCEGKSVDVWKVHIPASRDTCGLGLNDKEYGTIYGIFGSAAFILGSVLGGYFTSWLGLKRTLVTLILAMNLPMLAYLYLSIVRPSSHPVVTSAVCVEMFGYGFGYVGVILLMMQEIAPGKYQTAHYAFANSLMNLGLLIPGAVSGVIAKTLGYQKFFIWVVIASVPALIMARFLPLTGGKQANDPEAAQA
jgi:PAT family beta-lactamase induction signal transducer AmpG